MPSLVATTSTPAWKPFVRTHYVRTNIESDHQNFMNVQILEKKLSVMENKINDKINELEGKVKDFSFKQ